MLVDLVVVAQEGVQHEPSWRDHPSTNDQLHLISVMLPS